MAVRVHSGLAALTLALVFAGGWLAASLSKEKPSARAEVLPQARLAGGSAAAEPTSCTDRLAMEANANLVGQVHEARGQLALAQSHTLATERKLAAIAQAPSPRLVTSAEEWARMAKEGTIRVRMPCSRWNAGGRYAVRTTKRGSLTTGSSRNFETARRADTAGLSSEEQETLAEVYTRTHARSWAAMRSACESNADYREAIAEQDEPSEQVKMTLCSARLLDVNEPSTRVALTRVAELRAAGAGLERAGSDAERVAFAFTDGPSILHDELVKALGREKATRAVDNGVLCVDESVYDVRQADPEG